MNIYKVFTVVIIFFMTLSCSAKNGELDKENRNLQYIIVDQTIGSLDYQWLENENDFNFLISPEKLKTKNGQNLNKKEKSIIFDRYWDKYFNIYFLILKANFYYDETFSIGLHGEYKKNLLENLNDNIIKDNILDSTCDNQNKDMCKYNHIIQRTKWILFYYALEGKDINAVKHIIKNNKEEALPLYLKEF